MSTPTRIGLAAVILAPLLLVGSLLLLVNRQPAPAVGQFDAVAFNRAIAEGDAHLAAGEFRSRSDQLRPGCRGQSPVRPSLQSSWATCLLAQGEVKQAIEQYEAAIKIDGSYALAYFQIGEAYRSQGDGSAALAQYERALRVNPAFADAYIQSGGIYQERGDLARAEALYNEALAAAVTDARSRASALTRLGNLEALAGQTDRAIARYQEAQQEDPGFAGSYIQLGQV
jgi:tetratricopeptide (TPR) repeat protein